MDADRFDALTRSFTWSAPASRRVVFGLVLGAGSAALSADELEARKKGKGKARGKKKNKKKSSPAGTCKALGEECANDCCSSLTCGGIVLDVCCSNLGGSCSSHIDCCFDDACGLFAACSCNHGTCSTECDLHCPNTCCDAAAGEVCASPKADILDAVCQPGGCPTTDYCNDETDYRCSTGFCLCMTSIEGKTVCNDRIWKREGSCIECTSDEFCAQFGEGSVCVRNGEFCTEECASHLTAFCVRGACD